MGTPSNNRIGRLSEVKQGDRVKAANIKRLDDAIRRLTRTGQGERNGAFVVPHQPFFPDVRIKDGTDPREYEISISKGYVVEHVIAGTESLTYHEPTGVTFDGVPTRQEIADTECLYVVCEVADDGTITGTPTIEVDVDNVTNEHYRPEVGESSGAAGTYKYKVCKMTVEDGLPRLELFYCGQNIQHYAERVTMLNIGDATVDATEYNVLKEYDPATDEIKFRNIEQRDDDGETIIAIDGVDSIPFKRIGDRVSNVQVNVSTVGDKVQIEGNNVDGENDAVTVVDGLVTAVKSLTCPWQATANGGSVDIGAGKVLGIRDAGTPGATPWNFIYISYAGSNITFTGAGYIYLIVAITPRSIGEDATGDGYISSSQEPTSISVEFSADDPTTVALATTGEVCIPICEVAGGGTTASVVDQILTHNPMLTIETTVSMP